MVYVISKDGQPLMPTKRHGKVRRLLKSGKAKVTKRCPFTIQLLYDSTAHTQPVSLGIDAGSRHIGVSATTKDEVLYEADGELRNDIVKLISTRRELRRSRRSRNLRHRKMRFNNRKRENGWLPPSVRQKMDTHITVVRKVCEILPVTEITVEVASFDIQKIKNPEIYGAGYQEGEQLGIRNVRAYVLARDKYKCQCCHGKSKDKRLHVHHIESRQTGGNAPNNLVTLCKTCHERYHKGVIELPESVFRGMKFTDTTFMNIAGERIYDKLRTLYSPLGIEVKKTFGYITASIRKDNSLPKEHYIDARCISGHPSAQSDGTVFYQKKVRCHNRQIHKSKPQKGGIRKRNQTPYIVKGFRLFDKVEYNEQECFIFGRRTSGSMDVRLLDGTRISPCAGYRRLKLLEKRRPFLTERRKPLLPRLK